MENKEIGMDQSGNQDGFSPCSDRVSSSILSEVSGVVRSIRFIRSLLMASILCAGASFAPVRGQEGSGTAGRTGDIQQLRRENEALKEQLKKQQSLIDQ